MEGRLVVVSGSLSFLDPFGPPMEARRIADQVRVGLKVSTVFGLDHLKFLNGCEVTSWPGLRRSLATGAQQTAVRGNRRVGADIGKRAASNAGDEPVLWEWSHRDTLIG